MDIILWKCGAEVHVKKHKQLMWAGITLLIGILTIVAVISQSRELTFSELLARMRQMNAGAQVLVYLCIAGYILSEGMALWLLCREAGYKRSLLDTTIYGASDIYCAAITPSATGGQPVCAWFMKRDHIPMGYITAILSIYLIVHTFSTLTVGLLGALMGRDVLRDMSILSKILVVLGYLTICLLAFLFVAVTRWHDRIIRVGNKIIDGLVRKGWLKREEYWKTRLRSTVDDYSTGVQGLSAGWKILFQVYLLNLAQRLCQTVISAIVYSATVTGGSADGARKVFVSQIFSMIGSSCMPVPGGMGFADYLLFDGIHTILDKETALQMELMARGFSFYICIIICLVIVLAGYLLKKTEYAILKL